MSDKLITLERLQQYHGLLEDKLNDTVSDAVTDLSVSGKVITYTKKDGTTGTITTQDTGIDYSSFSSFDGSTQVAISSLVSSSSAASGSSTVTTNKYFETNTGMPAGIYTLQSIIQSLINISHTHKTSSTTTTTNCNCNCNCSSDCH